MSAQWSRYLGCLACGIVALVMLFCGWLMPVHLRAVDVAVIQDAGRNAAAAGQDEGLIRASAGETRLFGSASEPVTPFLIRLENREKALAYLGASPLPAVQELLRCRSLTNTVLFPPSSSAAGQAFDVAVAMCGMLLDGGHLTPALSGDILACATAASHGGDTRPMEEILLDELSLGQRFDWRRLVIFNERMNDPHNLAFLAGSVRNAGDQWPVLFSAVELSQEPSEVAHYLSNFSQTGLLDLEASERFGAGGVDELLRRGQRLYSSTLRQRVAGLAPFDAFSRLAADYALRRPHVSVILQWCFYMSGGFFIAVALQLAKPGAVEVEQEGQTRGASFARELLFASGVLLVALLLSEPFLAQENQKVDFPFRLHLSSVGGVVASQITGAKQSIMNTPAMTASLLTLLLFFVLQAMIYIACLARLGETLRQNVPARVKLKLLENEDHLFDAGLYLGFVGTIICLILVSLGVIQFSLMAAYSSTSFGIIFVSVLKIFNVRPARRRLLLQAEEESVLVESPVRMSASTLVPAP
jgi:hypothetical protein